MLLFLWLTSLDRYPEKEIMNFTKMLAIAAVTSLTVAPALAQTAQTTPNNEQNGHHYSGGPKTEVPHHMGKKDMGMGMSSGPKKGPSGSHHYTGGPNTHIPHHTGAK